MKEESRAPVLPWREQSLQGPCLADPGQLPVWVAWRSLAFLLGEWLLGTPANVQAPVSNVRTPPGASFAIWSTTSPARAVNGRGKACSRWLQQSGCWALRLALVRVAAVRGATVV